MVYFVRDDVKIAGKNTKIFKIGCGVSIQQILGRYKTHNPFAELFCTVPGYKNLESLFHHHFEKYRVSGTREWFRITDEMVLQAIDKFDLVPSFDFSRRATAQEASLLGSWKPLFDELPVTSGTRQLLLKLSLIAEEG